MADVEKVSQKPVALNPREQTSQVWGSCCKTGGKTNQNLMEPARSPKMCTPNKSKRRFADSASSENLVRGGGRGGPPISDLTPQFLCIQFSPLHNSQCLQRTRKASDSPSCTSRRFTQAGPHQIPPQFAALRPDDNPLRTSQVSHFSHFLLKLRPPRRVTRGASCVTSLRAETQHVTHGAPGVNATSDGTD